MSTENVKECQAFEDYGRAQIAILKMVDCLQKSTNSTSLATDSIKQATDCLRKSNNSMALAIADRNDTSTEKVKECQYGRVINLGDIGGEVVEIKVATDNAESKIMQKVFAMFRDSPEFGMNLRI